MTLHCSRAGFSPEIDWPTACRADPGVFGMCHSMALECIWRCTATCIFHPSWWRLETMWIRCIVINQTRAGSLRLAWVCMQGHHMSWLACCSIRFELKDSFQQLKFQSLTWLTPRCSTRWWPSALLTCWRLSRFLAAGPSLALTQAWRWGQWTHSCHGPINSSDDLLAPWLHAAWAAVLFALDQLRGWQKLCNCPKCSSIDAVDKVSDSLRWDVWDLRSF